MSHLQKFYAVTMTRSLYIVEMVGQHGRPAFRKLDAPLEIEDKGNDGNVVAISSTCLRHGYRAEGMTQGYAPMGHTSGIVALFLDEPSARLCHAAPDIQRLDVRWKSRTRSVLEAIGTNHPCFLLPKNHTFVYDSDAEPLHTGRGVWASIARFLPWA